MHNTQTEQLGVKSITSNFTNNLFINLEKNWHIKMFFETLKNTQEKMDLQRT